MFAADRHAISPRGPWSRATTSAAARLNAMRHVLAGIDYEGKDPSVATVPDPLIVGRAPFET